MMAIAATSPKRNVFQVADVQKTLLSSAKVADAGYECCLHSRGGYLFDTYSGEHVPMSRRGRLHIMKARVRGETGSRFRPAGVTSATGHPNR